MGKQVAAGFHGGLAQLGEHLPCKQGVESSNLLVSTKAMRSGLTDMILRVLAQTGNQGWKRRANARDEVSEAYESHDELLEANETICCLYLENRIPNQKSIKPCEMFRKRHLMEIETRHLKAKASESKQEVCSYYARYEDITS